MTKSEKFAKAIKEALATVEQRRALYWKLCHEYAAKSAEEGSNEELINQLSAFLFATKATNLEAQAVCACYIAYTDLFEAQTRENSPRLQPIRDAIRAAGYSVDYDPTTIVYKSGQNAVSASFSVGPWNGSSSYTYGRSRLLNGDHLRSELKRLKEAASGKTPAEIISDAEAAAATWQMLEKQYEDYRNNVHKLRQMLKGISFYNWTQIWHI